jgi:hypothetical protein
MPLHQHILAGGCLFPGLDLVAPAVRVLFVLNLLAVPCAIYILELVRLWLIIVMKSIVYYGGALHSLKVMLLLVGRALLKG